LVSFAWFHSLCGAANSGGATVECIMERNELIDLGAASVETKGPGGPIDDQVLGILVPGLAND